MELDQDRTGHPRGPGHPVPLQRKLGGGTQGAERARVASWREAAARGFLLRCPHCGRVTLLTLHEFALSLDCRSCGLQFERQPYAAHIPQIVVLVANVALGFAAAGWLLPRVSPHEGPVAIALGVVVLALFPSCLGLAVAWHYRERVRERNVTDPIPPVPRWAGVTPPIFVATARGLRAFANVHEAERHLDVRDLVTSGVTPAYDAKGVWFDVYREVVRSLGPGRTQEYDERARFTVRLKVFPDQPPRPEALRALLVEFLSPAPAGIGNGVPRDPGLSLGVMVSRAVSRLQPSGQQHQAGADQVGFR